MKNTKAKQVKPVVKPYLTGSPTDERTVREALGFLGTLLIAGFMSFLVCSMAGSGMVLIRFGLNLAIIFVILMLFFNRGEGKGTDAVAKGEILWQRREKGLPVSTGEQKLSYHPLKGFVIAFAGTALVLIPVLVFALIAKPQETGSGVLPGWMDIYLRRSEIGDPLVHYTQVNGLNVADILRIFTRISVMPFINLAGTENREALLTVERLSPLIVLLPAAAFGIGYTRGQSIRTRVHTEISESTKKRVRRERKVRKARMSAQSKGPKQLN